MVDEVVFKKRLVDIQWLGMETRAISPAVGRVGKGGRKISKQGFTNVARGAKPPI